MDRSYWHKQTKDEPLYPDVLWSRPENKRLAGKLLIVGGGAHGFAAPAAAYSQAVKAGIGTVRVILPDSLLKTVGRLFPEAEFAASTPSGSFSRQSVAHLCDLAAWADGVLLAGDFGRNSETAAALEQFVNKYAGQLTLTQDSLDYFAHTRQLTTRPDTLLVPAFAQLQKQALTARFATPLTAGMDFLHLIDALHDFTMSHLPAILLPHAAAIFAAVGGEVSTTRPLHHQPLLLASHAAVWWLQHPNQAFEALSSSLIEA